MNIRKRLTNQEFTEGIIAGNKLVLSKAITLIESSRADDQQQAGQLIELLWPYVGNSLRIGITGVPGVGKSTFIESFGSFLTSLGKKVAVLAIDPSSKKTKGSILGDKTRMERLAHNPLAFIRPSSAGDSLGGVSHKTREAMLLCEAAGFDIIIIETVGVGQSETIVADMVDFFLLLMLAGAGDELQGIKKGIMEMADAIAITKADSGNEKAAKKAIGTYQSALHLFPLAESAWIPKVMSCSALKNEGMEEIWKIIEQYSDQTKSSGYFAHKRTTQQIAWMHQALNFFLKSMINQDEVLRAKMQSLEKEVGLGKKHGINAARELLQLITLKK